MKFIRILAITKQFCSILILSFLSSNVLGAEYTLRTTADIETPKLGVPFTLIVQFFFDTCCIRSPIWSQLEISGAEVSDRSFPPEQYEETIAGVRFGVYRFHYSITPNQLGILTIPAITMTGEVLPSGSAFGTPVNADLHSVSVSSEEFTLEVSGN